MPDATQSISTAASLADRAGELRVERTRTMRGPSVAGLAPVVLGELTVGQLATIPPADAPGFMDRLSAALPAVAHLAPESTSPSWGEVLAGVISELQRRAGSPVTFATATADASANDRWTVAIGYDEEELASEALYDAARVLRDCLRGDDPEIERTVADLAERYERVRPDASTRLLIASARHRGIAVRRIADDPVVQLGLGRTRRRIHGTATDRTSAIAMEVASSPRRTRATLREVEIDLADAATGRRHRAIVVDGRVVACVELVPGIGDQRETMIDRTDELHQANRTLCELAASAVGLDVAAIDLVSSDVGVPLRANGGAITAVHASPDIAPFGGHDLVAARDVPGAIVEMLFPSDAPSTIPVIAVTGTNGKTTTTRLIAHLFRESGACVGFTTTDGVYLQEQRLLEGDLTGPFAANIILSHPEVDVAVLETARGGILRAGLGFDNCDVGVVLNVTADHLGLGGVETVDQLADVKAVIAAVVKPSGHTVLNADDPRTYAMRERTPGEIVLFTTRPLDESPHVQEHLELGGVVALVERGEDEVEQLVIRDGAERVVLATVREVPLTFEGAARFQVGNILAAAAVAHVRGLSVDVIRGALLSFLPSAARTPGRLNVIETRIGRVIVDYAHNAAAIAGLLDFVTRMPADYRMAILSVPGDRRDEDMRTIGALAAGLDYVIFKEHERYRRGRPAGEAARMLAEALLATGFPADRVVHFDDERVAVAHAIGIMRPGTVVAIMADDGSAVLDQLRPHIAAEE